jgi:hypothetical protein
VKLGRYMRAGIALVSICGAIAIGCGGGGGAQNAGHAASELSRGLSAADDIARVTDDAARARALGRRRVPTSTTQVLDSALRQLQESKEIDQLLVAGFCDGMRNVAATGQLPNGQDWFNFLKGYVQGRVLSAATGGVPLNIIDTKVQQFTTTAQLAQINPAYARLYLQRCNVLGL